MLSQPSSINSNIIVENKLDDFVVDIEKMLNSDVLTFFGPLIGGVDSEVRDIIELNKDQSDKLMVILETPGGYTSVVQRIVDTLRKHYNHVEFLIPNFAMSAGTILVMSGDAIHMDYFSVLGPIDPQVQRPGGNDLIPALGYLEKYDQLIKKSKDGTLTNAELNYLIEKFDPAELNQYEHERELSISLIKKWLVIYKFKNWKKTETKKKPVTDRLRKQRAVAIGKKLNDTKRWHSHSRGISMEVLRREVNLKIEDYSLNKPLNDLVKSYYRLFKDYMTKRGIVAIVHSKEQLKPMLIGA